MRWSFLWLGALGCDESGGPARLIQADITIDDEGDWFTPGEFHASTDWLRPDIEPDVRFPRPLPTDLRGFRLSFTEPLDLTSLRQGGVRLQGPGGEIPAKVGRGLSAAEYLVEPLEAMPSGEGQLVFDSALARDAVGAPLNWTHTVRFEVSGETFCALEPGYCE